MKSHILIVDDEIEITSSLSRALTFDGYKVLTAPSGEEALAILFKQKIDILISDIMMPGMSGIELLKRVRTEYPMIQVIMMTGYVKLSFALECLQHQARNIIFKPFHDISEIKESVEESDAYIQRWHSKLTTLQGMKIQ